MDYIQAEKLLREHGQEHVLRFYDELSDREKQTLLGQIASIDWRIFEVLSASDVMANRGKFEPLGALTVEEIAERKQEFELAGTNALAAQKVGAVLLAGGQGTRLGLDKPKGMLNVGVNKTLYLFEAHIKWLLHIKDICGKFVPLYVMTSDINNADTVAFFKEHDYFGYDKNYIKFFIQEMTPAVDYNGKIYMSDKGSIALSPNGNGGWFRSMIRAGLVDEMKEKGIEYLSAFSVDNVLQKINDPAFVGATVLSGADIGAKVVRKADEREKVGVLCLEDGKPSIVEYYEMTDEMAELKDENGRLAYAFGVILNYMFKLDKLIELAGKDMPLHIVKKKIPYIDENGKKISPDEPNGYKFETLILDMVHLMDSCLSYEVVREKEFAPIKNRTGVDSLESARDLMKLNDMDF